MRSFFKIFFASLLALVLFTVIAGLVLAYMVGKAASPGKPDIGSNGILVLDLGTGFKEQSQDNPLSAFSSDAEDSPGLHDVVRMIDHARGDTAIKGIYLKAGGNANGFAASEEIRQALLRFRAAKKFVIAYGEVISQKGYYVATAADKIYCHPNGGVEWDGYASTMLFMKGLLDKLEIEPQVFFAGKFKSATEPFRVTQMTDANRLQTTVLLNDLYSRLLVVTAAARHNDTAALHALANNGSIQTASDALKYNLVDGLKYDDEIKSELFGLMHVKETAQPNFILPGKYVKSFEADESKNKIALIYAQGDIVDGKGEEDEIGSDAYKNLIRKARFDSEVKAIVFRVNSPGGSALASDVIWREIALAKKEKPVIVSMGDLAASGGYYISCNGDSVFADPGTLTGSIGVFSIVPNMQSFFKNKLGITFDRVKTGTYAGMGDASQPMSEAEKRFMQAGVDSIYYTFKSRVAEGRKKSIEYIDSIAQGRVWTGTRAIEVGLVDRIGTLQDALASAARMSKVSSYSIAEYPEKKSLLDQLMGGSVTQTVRVKMMKEEIGSQDYETLQQLKKVKTWFGIPQTRLPFEMTVR